MALTRPRFRRDLIAVPVVVDGISYVDVRDPNGGEPFRFYDFEYKVALAFGGLPFERVVPWVRISAGLELTEEQLREFAEELGRRGFLEDREGPTPAPVDVPSVPTTRNATLSMVAVPVEAAPPAPVEAAPPAPDEAAPPAPDEAAPPAPDEAAPPAPDEAAPPAPDEVATSAFAETPPPVSVPSVAFGEMVSARSTPMPVAVEATPAAPPFPGKLEEPPTASMALATPGPHVPDVHVPSPDVVESSPPAAVVQEASASHLAAATMDMRLDSPADEFAFEPTVASSRRAAANSEGVTPLAATLEPRTPMAVTPLEPPPSQPFPKAAPQMNTPTPVVPPSHGGPRETPLMVTPPTPVQSPVPPGMPSPEPANTSDEPSLGMSLAEELSSVISPVPPTMDARAMDVAKRAAEQSNLWEPVAEAQEEGGLPPVPTTAPEPPAVEGEVSLPAWMSPVQAPPAIMTPAPVTFGPALSAEAPSAVTVRRRRRSFLLFASLGLLAGTLVFVLSWQLVTPEKSVTVPKIRTLKVALSTLHRFYPSPAEVFRAPGKVFTLPVAGKIVRLPLVGARVTPGEPLVQTEKSKPLAAQLAHARERLAYNTQLRDALRAEGKTAESEAQEPKIAERSAQIEKILQTLSGMVPMSDMAGEVEAVMQAEGVQAAAGTELLRLKSSGYRAQFSLSKPEVARARRERLCILWIGDRMLDCRLADTAENDGLVAADVPDSVAGSEILGKPARLIRALYRNATEVPARTVVHGETSKKVWLVSPRGRVEPRPVTVAEEDDESAILVQGVDDGDVLVAEPSPALSAGSLIRHAPPEVYRPRLP